MQFLRVRCMVDKPYYRANLRSSFRPMAHFTVELELCDRATPPTFEKLLSRKRCYARVWRFRILRLYRKSIEWTWVEPFELNFKIERELNFDLDNESRF